MKKIRLSYSVLKAARYGQMETALEMMLKRPTFSSEELELGKEVHEKWEGIVNKNSQVPEMLGGDKLKSPITEKKLTVTHQVGDYEVTFVGVIDCIDEWAYDWKLSYNGVSNSMNSMQGEFYLMLLHFNGYRVKGFQFRSHDLITETRQTGVIKNDPQIILDVIEWADSIAQQIIQEYEFLEGVENDGHTNEVEMLD